MNVIKVGLTPNGSIKYLVITVPEGWNSYNWDLGISIKSPEPLKEYNFNDDTQLYEYMDYRLSLIRENYWEIKSKWNVEDDMVPTLKVRLAFAEVPAVITEKEPIHMGQTSYIQPIIENYEDFDFDSIKFNEQSNGAKVLLKETKYLMEKGKGKFLVQPRMNMNPSDLARVYRGDPLFTDFYDYPEYVHELYRKCTETTIKYNNWAFNVVGAVNGGFPCTWTGGYWVPGTILQHVGDDVSDLVSSNMFRDFILSYLSQLSEYFLGGDSFLGEMEVANTCGIKWQR